MNATPILGDTLDLNELTGMQDPNHKSDAYIHCVIPEHLRDKVFFYKTEPVDPGICDTLHDVNYPWVLDFVGLREGREAAYRTLNFRDGTSQSQGLPEDAGLILTFHGKPVGSVAIDLNAMREYSEAEAAGLEEQFNTRFPRYTKWAFRIHSIIKTDGPTSRQRLFESVEQQRARANADMASSITQAFMQVLALLKSSGNAALTAEAEKLAEAAGPPVDPEVAKLQAFAQQVYREAENDRIGTNVPAGDIEVRPKRK